MDRKSPETKPNPWPLNFVKGCFYFLTVVWKVSLFINLIYFLLRLDCHWWTISHFDQVSAHYLLSSFLYLLKSLFRFVSPKSYWQDFLSKDARLHARCYLTIRVSLTCRKSSYQEFHSSSLNLNRPKWLNRRHSHQWYWLF